MASRIVSRRSSTTPRRRLGLETLLCRASTLPCVPLTFTGRSALRGGMHTFRPFLLVMRATARPACKLVLLGRPRRTSFFPFAYMSRARLHVTRARAPALAVVSGPLPMPAATVVSAAAPVIVSPGRGCRYFKKHGFLTLHSAHAGVSAVESDSFRTPTPCSVTAQRASTPGSGFAAGPTP